MTFVRRVRAHPCHPFERLSAVARVPCGSLQWSWRAPSEGASNGRSICKVARRSCGARPCSSCSGAAVALRGVPRGKTVEGPAKRGRAAPAQVQAREGRAARGALTFTNSSTGAFASDLRSPQLEPRRDGGPGRGLLPAVCRPQKPNARFPGRLALWGRGRGSGVAANDVSYDATVRLSLGAAFFAGAVAACNGGPSSAPDSAPGAAEKPSEFRGIAVIPAPSSSHSHPPPTGTEMAEPKKAPAIASLAIPSARASRRRAGVFPASVAATESAPSSSR